MDLANLILVPGHAIVRDVEKLDTDEGWFLKPFQAGEGPLYVEHVRYGVRLAAEDPRALLVFSGSRTDRAAGERSEAAGYRMIAERYLWEGSTEVRDRTTIEEFALDSFQNLHYALCLFREHTGAEPAFIHVVGWAFKERRFGFHCETLGVAADCFRYHGVNNPAAIDGALRHEAETLRLFHADPTGSSGILANKRAARNPFGLQPNYPRI